MDIENRTPLEEAVDKIDTLKADLKTANEPKWIPVSERLPESNDLVLCYLNADGACFMDATNYDGEDWWDVGDCIVTHWQPLPTPPAQENENG